MGGIKVQERYADVVTPAGVTPAGVTQKPIKFFG